MNLEDIGKILLASIISGELAFLVLRGQSAVKNRQAKKAEAKPQNVKLGAS